MAIFKQELKQI
jgi:hypothetical protein